jgi:hypothetical protein
MARLIRCVVQMGFRIRGVEDAAPAAPVSDYKVELRKTLTADYMLGRQEN